MTQVLEENLARADAITHEALLGEIDNELQDPLRNRPEHPFVKAVQDGTATIDQIAGWTNQFSRWAGPLIPEMYVLIDKCPPDEKDLREAIMENIEEEESGLASGTANHMELCAHSLKALGWDEARRAQDPTRYETWTLKHWLEILLHTRPFYETIMMMSFAMERINPTVFGKLLQGLRKHYDFTEDDLLFYTVHASEVEEEHGMLGPVAMERYATQPNIQDDVRFVCLHGADIYYQFYNVWKYY